MPTTSRQEQIQMNDDVEVWTMEFQAHVTIILYRNRLGSSFPKCLWKMEDLFNNHADHSCDSWMVPVLNSGVQFNGIIGLCKKNIYLYIYIYTVHIRMYSPCWCKKVRLACLEFSLSSETQVLETSGSLSHLTCNVSAQNPSCKDRRS